MTSFISEAQSQQARSQQAQSQHEITFESTSRFAQVHSGDRDMRLHYHEAGEGKEVGRTSAAISGFWRGTSM